METLENWLDAQQMTMHEYNMLCTVHYVVLRPCKLIVHATRESKLGGGVVSRRPQCEDALVSLLAKRLVQLVDDRVLRRIDLWLQQNPAEGPFEELPGIGTVDLTLRGAEFWSQLDRDVFGETESFFGIGIPSCIPEGAVSDRPLVCCDSTIWSTNLESCDSCFQESQDEDVIAVSKSEIRSIGRWRFKWWHDFASGYELRFRVYWEDE